MAITFTLSIDLTGHVHQHAPTAHRHTVAQLLDKAKQVLASSAATHGDLTITAPNMPPQVLGTWQFADDGA
jgi:selenophosphate synthetase-related protein